ncbi:U-box domain-containing protein 27 [Bienertia sinuspersici]
MKSPVSLSTGVTYDRTSIQRWLDNGNNTCPATMQVLDSKDFVPNHTLQRLIQIWYNNNSSNHSQSAKPPQFRSLSSTQIADLIKQLLQGRIAKPVSFESFVKILCFASESADNRRFLSANDKFIDHLIVTVSAEVGSGPGSDPDLLEAVLKILHLIIASRDNNTSHVREKISNSCEFIPSLVRAVKTGRPGSRVAAVGITEELTHHPESKKPVFDHQELVPELLELVKHGKLEKDGEIQAVLSCLISLTSSRRNKIKLVRAGGVKLVGDIISVHGGACGDKRGWKLCSNDNKQANEGFEIGE